MPGIAYVLALAGLFIIILAAFGLNPFDKAQEVIDEGILALDAMERTALQMLNELVATRDLPMAKRRMMSLIKQRKLPRPGYVTRAHLRCGPASVAMCILFQRIERGDSTLTPTGIVHTLTPTR